MCPAPLAADLQPDRQLNILARALEALLLTIQHISSKEEILHERLKDAHNEYLKLANRLPEGFDSHTKIVSEKILGRRLEHDNPPKQNLNTMDVVKNLAESGNVGDSSLDAITEGVRIYKSFLNPDDDGSTGLVETRAGLLERDFTTKGTRGSLRCPFSKSPKLVSENGFNGVEPSLTAQNTDSCGFQRLDPIKEERIGRRSSQSPSVHSPSRCPASRCPIRFLNQHSPEEIADYVERHKHEIPRSHAICVKRYSNSSRQMDAKYGDLTNMIRGLSEKHQAFLPGQHARTNSSSVDRVGKWAEEISSQSPDKGDEAVENDGYRDGHFDRPMREVRVGESPSRPWGIHVPIPSPPRLDSSAQLPLSPRLSTDKPLEITAIGVPKSAAKVVAPAGRCPFGHGGGAPPPDHPTIEAEPVRIKEPANPPSTRPSKEEESPADESPKTAAPNIVFNGPVFFGFSPEQTATFMQQLASLEINKS
ncbi:hypothetical protein BJX70DRAFT_364380 [Aspergillus crustosus]